MRTLRYQLTVLLGALVAVIALATPAYGAQGTDPTATGAAFDPLPNLPVNACNDSTLPRDYGTNFPVPSDPNGFGFANQTAIGWEGNFYAPIAYLSGSYFARGVPTRYQPRRQAYCGAMYSFCCVRLRAGPWPGAGARLGAVDHGRRLPARADHVLHA